jgi:hypothetical protein
MKADYEITILNVFSNTRETKNLYNVTTGELAYWLISEIDSNKYTILEIKNKIIINY